MGVDNEAILVYGWLFDYDKMVNIVNKIFISLGYDQDEIDMTKLLEEDLQEWLLEKHPDFKVGRASPYYDACYTENDYYISFAGDSDRLKEIIKHPEVVETYELVQMLDLKTPPGLYALSNIY